MQEGLSFEDVDITLKSDPQKSMANPTKFMIVMTSESGDYLMTFHARWKSHGFSQGVHSLEFGPVDMRLSHVEKGYAGTATLTLDPYFAGVENCALKDLGGIVRGTFTLNGKVSGNWLGWLTWYLGPPEACR